MNNRNVWKKLESILIYLLLTYIVFMGVIPFSFLDELIVILLIGVQIVKDKRCKIDKRKLGILLSYIVITFFTVLIRRYYLDAYIADLIYTLKPFILLEAIIYMNIEDKKMDKYMWYLIILNIISIMYGLYNYYLSSKGVYIEGGQYRDWVYRISGFGGHPANLANTCMISIAYLFQKILNNKSKKNKYYIVIIILNLISIYLTMARLQLFLLIAYFIYCLYNKISNNYFKIIFVLTSVLICVLTLLTNYDKIFGNFSDDFDNAIRFYAIKKVPEVLNEYPLLGTGIGSFSTLESIELNSYVYNEFDFSHSIMETVQKTSVSLFESNFAKQLIQTGIIGTSLYYFYFYILYKSLKYKKGKSINAKFWLMCIMISSVLNVIYDVQLLVPLALLIANTNTNREEEVK